MIALRHRPAQGNSFGTCTDWVRGILYIGSWDEVTALFGEQYCADAEVAVRAVGGVLGRDGAVTELVNLLGRESDSAGYFLSVLGACQRAEGWRLWGHCQYSEESGWEDEGGPGWGVESVGLQQQ